MVIAVIAKINHEVAKVPGWEQMLTAGAATYALQLAGNALGFDSFWATGPLIEGRELREAFGCGKMIRLLPYYKLVRITTGSASSEKTTECVNQI